MLFILYIIYKYYTYHKYRAIKMSMFATVPSPLVAILKVPGHHPQSLPETHEREQHPEDHERGTYQSDLMVGGRRPTIRGDCFVSQTIFCSGMGKQ